MEINMNKKVELEYNIYIRFGHFMKKSCFKPLKQSLSPSATRKSPILGRS